MTIYGVDVSGYQSTFNFARCKSEGFDFAIIKATEGDNYVNPSYRSQLSASVASGLLTSSYHFVHANDVPGQLAELERYVDKNYPVWLDSEVDGAGEYNASVQLHDQARRDGWNVVGDYFPHWFWSNIGSPNLAPLGALWSSGYPGGGGGAAAIYASIGGDNAAGWNPYGGVTPSLYQFTDAATVAGWTGIDCSAFRGTRDQLAALLQGDTMTPQDLLDFVLGVDQAGNTVTLSKVIQSIGLNPHTDTARATLDFALNSNGSTLSLAAQAINAGTAKVQAQVTIDPAQLQTALTAAIAASGVAGVDAATVKSIVTSALAALTLKAA